MANRTTKSILSFGKVTEGTKEYNFQTSSIYKSAPIAAATGITYIAPESFAGNEPLVKIEQMIRSGKLIRLNALVQNPKDGAANKTIEILCRPDLAAAARTDLVGKTLQLTKNGVTTTLGKILRIRGKTRDKFN
jgi:hypothetical protein